MPDPKTIKAAARAIAAAAAAELPALTAAAKEAQAAAAKAAAVRRSAKAAEDEADRIHYEARNRQNHAQARIDTAAALTRLITRPDGGKDLIDALRDMREGRHINISVRDMLIRRDLVTKPDRWISFGLTVLGRAVIDLYDEIAAAQPADHTATKDR